ANTPHPRERGKSALNFMAKFKSAGSKKAAPAKSARRAIPCLVIIALGIAVMCLLFYLSLQSNTP
ncbi:MAG: hypothetical protein ABSB86_09430, partial [Bryobacteraceae bacterium]